MTTNTSTEKKIDEKFDKASAELDINKTEDWAKIQQEWMKVQMEKAQARADKFFASDEELPLSSHLLLVSIAAFFVLFVLWANFASLDPSSEIRLLKRLTDICKNKTTIVITHKGQMLSLVDKIMLIDRGRILDFGPKDEIVKKLQARSYGPATSTEG